eukprot:TRINITY_DN4233_c0_g1_i2.p1 TRINITY_DN4233_c0_g1~~TRINITY_DN4233_c0_g1_i2.p1  ORF type:complete len:293 (+),score=28.89 TRINITY_DN4233_c0_g1_i2:341-1219(+)
MTAPEQAKVRRPAVGWQRVPYWLRWSQRKLRMVLTSITWGGILKVAAGALILVSIFAAVTMLPVNKLLQQFLLWLKMDVGPWGPLILILAYIPATILAFPGMILTMGGGYIYGLALGFVLDCIGSTAGATAAFILGRSVGRGYVVSKLKTYPQFQAIQAAIEKSGFRIVILLRLVPLVPFTALNYLLSVTPISIQTYVAASSLGMLPMTFMFVYIGTTIKNISDIGKGDHEYKHWIYLAAGLPAVGMVIALVAAYAKGALQKAMDESVVEGDTVPAPDMENQQAPLLETVEP